MAFVQRGSGGGGKGHVRNWARECDCGLVGGRAGGGTQPVVKANASRF